MRQKIGAFWMRQHEGLKVLYVVVIVLVLLWVKEVIFGSSDDNVVLDGSTPSQGVAIVDSNGKPVKAQPCGGKNEPRCLIFEKGFNTIDLITVTIVKGERPDNTTCTITYQISGRLYQSRYEIPGNAPCPTP
ncbi:MAG: hypothetical protein ACRERU_20515 [Methylococcales bacterium]